MNKALKFFAIILAFQNFAGKSLKCTDAAAILTDDEINMMETILRKLAKHYEGEKEFPDLQKLSVQIEGALNR